MGKRALNLLVRIGKMEGEWLKMGVGYNGTCFINLYIFITLGGGGSKDIIFHGILSLLNPDSYNLFYLFIFYVIVAIRHRNTVKVNYRYSTAIK